MYHYKTHKIYVEPEADPGKSNSVPIVDEEGLLDVLDSFMNQGWEFINSVPWGNNNCYILFFRCLRPAFVPFSETSRSPR